MKVRFFRRDGSHWDEDLEYTEHHCPNCGDQNVYTEKGDGDYYVGPSMYCRSCNFDFTMPHGRVNDKINWIEPPRKKLEFELTEDNANVSINGNPFDWSKQESITVVCTGYTEEE